MTVSGRLGLAPFPYIFKDCLEGLRPEYMIDSLAGIPPVERKMRVAFTPQSASGPLPSKVPWAHAFFPEFSEATAVAVIFPELSWFS